MTLFIILAMFDFNGEVIEVSLERDQKVGLGKVNCPHAVIVHACLCTPTLNYDYVQDSL